MQGRYSITSDYSKDGVTFKFSPGAIPYNTANLPAANPATFAAPVVLNWNRQAYVSQPGNAFLIWWCDFFTAYDLYETIRGAIAGTSTIQTANGRLSYIDSATASYLVMADKYIPLIRRWLLKCGLKRWTPGRPTIASL